MSAGIVGVVIGAVAGATIGAVAMGIVAGGSDATAEDMASAYAIGYGDGLHGRRPHPERAACLARAPANKPANKGDGERGWHVC